MANKEHLSILNSGKKAWNKWRDWHPEIEPDFSRAAFSNANLRGLNLQNADLRYANLSGADCHGTFRDSESFQGIGWATDLRYSNLHGATLVSANLLGARLRGANLTRANLANANLQKVVLREADLEGANLSGANIKGVYLRGTNGLTQSQVESAIGDQTTKLPRHLTMPKNWLAAEPSPPKLTDRPGLPGTHANLAWKSGKIRITPRDRTNEPVSPRYRDQLLETQENLSEDLTNAIQHSNADQNITRVLRGYSRETKRGSEDINIILLQSYIRILQNLLTKNSDALGDINLSELNTFFHNHNILGKCYPELKEFLDASATSAVAPDERARAELLKLPDILAEPPGPEVIEERLAEMAAAEAEEPDVILTHEPDVEHPNKSKWYGLAVLAARIYQLLKIAPLIETGLKAIETLVNRLKPIWEWLQSLP